MTSRVTYRQLDGLLRGLGFIGARVEGDWRAYTHAASGALILLANRGGAAARDADVASVRRHLVENGLIGEDEFADFLQGRQPGLHP